jgi:heme/copper-type cytochrome/quinol oxidase subunit 2
MVGRDDWWLAWCTMAIGTVIMLITLGSMCYCVIAHRLEKNTQEDQEEGLREPVPGLLVPIRRLR